MTGLNEIHVVNVHVVSHQYQSLWNEQSSLLNRLILAAKLLPNWIRFAHELLYRNFATCKQTYVIQYCKMVKYNIQDTDYTKSIIFNNGCRYIYSINHILYTSFFFVVVTSFYTSA